MKLSFLVLCCAAVVSVQGQNYIDNYLWGAITYTTIADNSNQVLSPRDLEFKPNTDELWVVNESDNSGGTNVIIYHAGLPSQVAEYRKDSHTSHFMLIPAAFAFSDIGEFATVGEAQSSNGGASTFMGPVLWSSDTNIFARVFQSNWANGKPLGSHLDMLHQSPMAMGIAHDTLEAYWVFDGYNSDICKYDFVTNHGPGYENHDNGIIYRYTDVDVQREPDVPSHIIKDKSTGWLYIVDTGHKKLIRINTNTGVVVDTLVTPGTAQETLDGYYEVQGVVQEVIDTFTTRPSGIALYNGRLIVGDYDNGDITIYDITGASPVMLGVIPTGQAGMEGIEIGTDGKIWFVNNTANTVVRMDATPAANDPAILNITAPTIINGEKEFYSTAFDLCSAVITPVVTLLNAGTTPLNLAIITYSIDNGNAVLCPWSGSLPSGLTTSVTLPSSPLPAGKHKIVVSLSTVNDDNPANNKKEGAFRSESPVQELPYAEDFSANTFPPVGWDYVNYNPNAFISRSNTVGGFGNSTGCFFMDNYSSYEDISGQRDYLLMPIIDLVASTAQTTFEFNVAYAQYNSGTNDRLQVMASTDCGNTWTTAYNKAGATLATAPSTTSVFVPSSTQWRHETINLTPYIGSPEVLFMFATESAFGNLVYVDDIAIADAGVSVNEIAGSSSMQVYPNPASGQITIALNVERNEPVLLKILDLQGRVVFEKSVAGISATTIEVANFARGVYTAEVSNDAEITKKKLVLE